MATTANSIGRLYQNARTSAMDAMGGERAFWIAGPSVREGFVSRAILHVLYIQDEDIPAERILEMLDGLMAMMRDDTDLH